MTFPDRWHHEDGTHRGTAQSTDGHELELFEAGFRQHVADGHVHCPECHGTDLEVMVPSIFKLDGTLLGFSQDDMACTLSCNDCRGFYVPLGSTEGTRTVPGSALKRFGLAVQAGEDAAKGL